MKPPEFEWAAQLPAPAGAGRPVVRSPFAASIIFLANANPATAAAKILKPQRT